MNTFQIPKVGSIISWYGTVYTVKDVTQLKNGQVSFAVVTVTQNNGVDLNLWWRDTEGCKIISSPA